MTRREDNAIALMRRADELGVSIAIRTARKWDLQKGTRGARDYLEQIGQLVAAARPTDLSAKQAAGYLMTYDTVELAIAAMLDRQSRDARVAHTGTCSARTAHIRRHADDATVDALARCACARCFETLTVRLRPIAQSVALRYAPIGLCLDDAEQEATLTLTDALGSWRRRGPFAAVFRVAARERLWSLGRRVAHRQAVDTLSLDLPLSDEKDSARLSEIVPDLRADTLQTVLDRERISTAPFHVLVAAGVCHA